MAQTVATYTDVLKEAWTSDRLEVQFRKKFPLFDKVEKYQATVIGKQAQVPIHGSRGGGETTLDSAGGALNAADRQRVDQAQYTLSYLYHPIELQTGVLNQGAGGSQSVGVAMDVEVQGAINNLRQSAMRQFASNGDALIAQAGTTTTSNEVELSTTGFGFDAIVRGWLRVGLQVDIGTTADEESIGGVGGRTITAVEKVAASPSITISGGTVTTSTSHFVSVAEAREGTTSNELNGLRNIVSTTAALGGLDPQTAGEEFWTAAEVNSTDTTVSLDLLLDLQRAIVQETGDPETLVACSLKQRAALYSLFQAQVRFPSDSVSAGHDMPKWNEMEVLGVPDIVDRELYMLSPANLCTVTGKIKQPTWMSDIEGAGGRLRWDQGNTGFKDAVVYPLQFAAKRRNSHAAATNLTG